MKCTPRTKALIRIYVGIYLIASGIAYLFAWPYVYAYFAPSQVVINNSARFLLVEPPADWTFSVYLFNWTNSDQVINSDWKEPIKVEERGPYVFSVKGQKTNVVDNDFLPPRYTVSYNQKKTYTFEPKLSNGSLDDLITTVNPLFTYYKSVTKVYGWPLAAMAINGLKNQKDALVLTKTVDELLFKGYNQNELKVKISHPTSVSTHYILTFPNYFGWFYGKNGSDTYDGRFTMNTGSDSLDKTGLLKLWNKQDFSSSYDLPCGKIDGSMGQYFPATLSESPVTVKIFYPELCSNLVLDKNGDEKISGITGDLYESTIYDFDNGNEFPEQSCFNPSNVRLFRGVRDISKCRNQQIRTTYVSFPHFYLADPRYSENIIGMNPDRSKHETSIVIEPLQGAGLQLKTRLQYNLLVEPITKTTIFSDIKKTYFPQFWYSETKTIASSEADSLKFLIYTKSIMFWSGWFCIVAGIIGLLFGMVQMYITLKKNDTVLKSI